MSLQVVTNSRILGFWAVYMSLQVVTNSRVLGFWGVYVLREGPPEHLPGRPPVKFFLKI